MGYYRVTIHRGGRKDVIWDIPDNHDVNRYPTLNEITEAASREFPGIVTDHLAVVVADGGDAIILKLARYVNC